MVGLPEKDPGDLLVQTGRLGIGGDAEWRSRKTGRDRPQRQAREGEACRPAWAGHEQCQTGDDHEKGEDDLVDLAQPARTGASARDSGLPWTLERLSDSGVALQYHYYSRIGPTFKCRGWPRRSDRRCRGRKADQPAAGERGQGSRHGCRFSLDAAFPRSGSPAGRPSSRTGRGQRWSGPLLPLGDQGRRRPEWRCGATSVEGGHVQRPWWIFRPRSDLSSAGRSTSRQVGPFQPGGGFAP